MATAHSIPPKYRRMDEEDIDVIRDCVLIGLTLYGDYMVRDNRAELMRACGKPIPEDMEPMDPIFSRVGSGRTSNALPT